MWWSRLVAAIAAVGFLAGCGFQPLYGGGRSGPAATELASIKVDPIADRSGQILRNHLLDLLTPYGRVDHPKYTLKVILNESASGLAVKKSEFTTRANLAISASYTLFDAGSKRILYTGSSSITGGYNILSSEFSTMASEQDVRERVIREIAGEMQNRLSAFFQLNQKQLGAGRTP
jgi:LPS-assembly lipoprotein